MRKIVVSLVLIILGIGFFASGVFPNNKDSKSSELKEKSEKLAACYHGIVGDSNSVFTIISQAGTSVKGSMSFVFAQKDSSYGTYVGSYENKILKATYTFWSEGVQSVGEYVFTKEGENFKGSGYIYKPAADCDQFLKK